MTRYGTILLVLYGGAVFIAALSAGLCNRPAETKTAADPPSLKAARPLGPNWLIKANDLTGGAPAEIVDHYAVGRIEEGAEVTVTNVHAVPAIGADALLLGLPVARTLVTDGHVNAGRRIRVCGGGQALPLQPAVEAVICPADATANCTALVRADPVLLGANDLLLRGAAATCAQRPADNPDSTTPARTPPPAAP